MQDSWGDLIEIHIGFLDREIPKKVPPVRKGDIYYFRDWIKPDRPSRRIKYIHIPPHLVQPIIFGRFYYKDVILKKLHSVGFILEIQQSWITRPIRAAEEYTQERDEKDDMPPTLP